MCAALPPPPDAIRGPWRVCVVAELPAAGEDRPSRPVDHSSLVGSNISPSGAVWVHETKLNNVDRYLCATCQRQCSTVHFPVLSARSALSAQCNVISVH